jgi:uncharacterized protein
MLSPQQALSSASAPVLWPAAREADVPLHFVLKVASRCNLDCSYCYVYHKGDDSWRDRPALMPDHVFEAALARMVQHCRRSQQRSLRIIFHGGEPFLAGRKRFGRWCQRIHDELSSLTRIELMIQTNGTLIDDAWVRVMRDHDVGVGISIDGPPEVHDRWRVDHAGRGSYADVVRGATLLRKAGIPLHILAVIALGSDGYRTHRHLLSLGPSSISYLLPDYTHDSIAHVRALHGATPCADFLIPIFDDWWTNGTIDLRISLFWNIARLILGGDSELDLLGNQLLRFLFIETDGSIEGLDVLRQCQPGIGASGLNVLRDGFDCVARTNALLRATVFTGVPTPIGCASCQERDTCGGGYLPHRYSESRGFDNPSVWCADLLALFSHIRMRLGVDPEETKLRRQALAALRQ